MGTSTSNVGFSPSHSVEGSTRKADETVRNGDMRLPSGEGDEHWQMRFGGLPGTRNPDVGCQTLEWMTARREMLTLELQIETLRRENESRAVHDNVSSAGSRLREEISSFSGLLKSVLTQMPASELLVPSWFDGVENVFETYKVPGHLRGPLIRPFFTEKIRAVVNRLPVAEASEYNAVKARVLLELKLSPAEYRRQFLNAKKFKDESWMQFVGRVESNLEYYVRGQGVDTLEELIALISADRIRDFMRPAMQEYVT